MTRLLIDFTSYGGLEHLASSVIDNVVLYILQKNAS